MTGSSPHLVPPTEEEGVQQPEPPGSQDAGPRSPKHSLDDLVVWNRKEPTMTARSKRPLSPPSNRVGAGPVKEVLTARLKALTTSSALLLLGCILTMGMVDGSSSGAIRWKCAETGPRYLHQGELGGAAGTIDGNEPQSETSSVQVSFRSMYPAWTPPLLWAGAAEEPALCALRGTLYVAAPASQDATTTRLNVQLSQNGHGVGRDLVRLQMSPTAVPVEIDIDFHTPAEAGPLHIGVVDVPAPGSATSTPIAVFYDSVEHPSHLTPFTLMPCEEDDPDPQCSEN